VLLLYYASLFFFSSRRRHTRCYRDWSSDVCSSDLNIGTAKPEPAQLTRVPHLGIDLIDPGERYSAGRFARDASGWLARVRAEGREPVVVGGTGFYIRALAEGLFREPPLEYARRERLRAWAGLLGAAPLAHWAARLDRRFAGGGRQRA